MKKLSIFIALFIAIVSCKGNENKSADSTAIKAAKQETKLKRYEVKSAIVHYKTIISGKVMGSTVKGSGTQSLYFKDWGNLELKEDQSSQTTHTKIFGVNKIDVQKTHTMNKLDNGKSYSVDFKQKKIYFNRDMAMEMTKMFANGDANKTGKQLLEGMGGKKVGNGKVLGYNCEIWDVMGGKQWVYKGLPLKIEITLLGITTSTIAADATFNTSVPNKYFKLPDFPIIKEEGYQNNKEYAADKTKMKQKAQQMKNLTFEEYKSMVIKEEPEAAHMSEKKMKQDYKMFKIMMQKMSK